MPWTCTSCKSIFEGVLFNRPLYVGVGYPGIRMITIVDGDYNAPGLQNREMKVSFQPLQLCSDKCLQVAVDSIIMKGRTVNGDDSKDICTIT